MSLCALCCICLRHLTEDELHYIAVIPWRASPVSRDQHRMDAFLDLLGADPVACFIPGTLQSLQQVCALLADEGRAAYALIAVLPGDGAVRPPQPQQLD